MPFQTNFEMKGFAQLRPKFGPLWGGSCGSLGCKSKCWVGSDSQFDNILTSCISAKECRFEEKVLKEMSSTHYIFKLNTSLQLSRKEGDDNPRQQSLEPLGKFATSLVPTVQRPKLALGQISGMCGLSCLSSLGAQ